jgi:hypothetical protein
VDLLLLQIVDQRQQWREYPVEPDVQVEVGELLDVVAEILRRVVG